MNASHLAVVVTLAIVVLTGFNVVEYATSDEMQEYIDDSADWCEDHGGDLHNAQALGSHGDLHCELPNGTSVHMHEVVELSITPSE